MLSPSRSRALVAATSCAVAAALAAAPVADAAKAKKKGRPVDTVYVYGGFATLQLDPAALAPFGVAVEARENAKPTSAGLSFKVVDGKTRVIYPLNGFVQGRGSMALVQGTNNISLTNIKARFTRKKSVLSARVGVNARYGPPGTLLRLAPEKKAFSVKGLRWQLRQVPVSLTAAGAALFNAQFGAGAAPFAPLQRVGTLTIKTKWYQI